MSNYFGHLLLLSRIAVRRCSLFLSSEQRGLSVCLSVGLPVCLLVCTLVSPAKTAESIEMPFGFRTREPCVRRGTRSPIGRGNFEGNGCPIVKYRDTLHAVISAKTPEPIEMPFGLWARMGLRNHVLDGSPDVLRDVAMATNLVTKTAITGFV